MSTDPSVTPLPTAAVVIDSPGDGFSSQLKHVYRLMSDLVDTKDKKFEEKKKLITDETKRLVKKDLLCSSLHEMAHFVTEAALTSEFWRMNSGLRIRLLYLCNKYLRLPGATIDDKTTWITIIAAVDAAEKETPLYSSASLAQAQVLATTLSTATKTDSMIEKNNIVLSPFSGDIEDWFKWKQSALVSLGLSSANKFLDDPELCAKYRKDAEKVWYALVGALTGGHASSIYSETEDSKDPCVVWSQLLEIYDKKTNEESEMMNALKGLLTLRLTDPNEHIQFVNQFRTYLSKLAEVNSLIAKDHAALRCILVLSLQHPDLRLIQHEISRDSNSNKTIKECLKILSDGAQQLRFVSTCGANDHLEPTNLVIRRSQLSGDGGYGNNSSFQEVWQIATGAFSKCTHLTTFEFYTPFCRQGYYCENKLQALVPHMTGLTEIIIQDGLYSYAETFLIMAFHLKSLNKLVLKNASFTVLDLQTCQSLALLIRSLPNLRWFELGYVKFESLQGWMLIFNSLLSCDNLEHVVLRNLTTKWDATDFGLKAQQHPRIQEKLAVLSYLRARYSTVQPFTTSHRLEGVVHVRSKGRIQLSDTRHSSFDQLVDPLSSVSDSLNLCFQFLRHETDPTIWADRELHHCQ